MLFTLRFCYKCYTYPVLTALFGAPKMPLYCFQKLVFVWLHVRIYRMAGNFGGKIFWRIAENMSFGGIYFGG